jgi:nucleotide-binding universal stress UspA family protein
VDYETGDEARATPTGRAGRWPRTGSRPAGRHGIRRSGMPPGKSSEARDFGAAVIVMGSRGHGGLAGLVLGSTAHKVIHLADRPVLVVR